MPYTLRACVAPGCRNLVLKGRCAVCRRAYAAQRGNPSAKGYDHAWLAIRAAVLLEEPCCRVCGTEQAPAHVDHILPLSKGGTHDRGNLQRLCRACHSTKTLRDRGGFGR
ncbi:MAG TPA: HNH endonuclease signature motif containing protein [Gemmatimonadales bacterium]|jgi:5-methylcytosine-specific restriction enzyme A|nr:HNH endonuclease signature motif containing protein [Gemmatimonadales bacterium]